MVRVFLDAHRAAIWPFRHLPDYHIEPVLRLVQPQLEISKPCVYCSPLYIKYAVWRAPAYRCENSALLAGSVHLLPVREYCVAHVRAWQALRHINIRLILAVQLQCSTRAYSSTFEGPVVQAHGEREAKRSYAIVAMIGGVPRPRHDSRARGVAPLIRIDHTYRGRRCY